MKAPVYEFICEAVNLLAVFIMGFLVLFTCGSAVIHILRYLSGRFA